MKKKSQILRAVRLFRKGEYERARVILARGLVGIRLDLLAKMKLTSIKSKYGPRFVSNFDDETFLFYIKGSYGKYYWDHLGAIGQRFVMIDVGANQGLFTLGAARNPNMVAAYAFEPVRDVFSLLEANLALNGAAGRCTPVNAAVASRAGRGHISLREGHSGVASMRAAVEGGDDQSEEIALHDSGEIDQIVRERGVPFVVKIDVEGLEEVVLAELFKTGFAEDIAEVFVEIDEDWVSGARVREFLSDRGFACQTVVGGGTHYDLLAQKDDHWVDRPRGG
jgi:FkbM family methyltransferase